MKKEFDKQFMIDNRGCYSLEELNNCSFMKKEVITLDDILNSEISIRDKYWFVCKKLATKEQNQQIAIGVAEIVLPIFEKKYPDNKAPREAIQAAKDYLNGVLNLEALINKTPAAAYAAAYIADAAYAAYAARASLLTYLKDFTNKINNN